MNEKVKKLLEYGVDVWFWTSSLFVWVVIIDYVKFAWGL